ncbi:MAG: SDR family NAD(P)-dependent oxidoreductase, partial [Planctomycetota bacterium]
MEPVPMFSSHGRIALVTGAATGLGQAIAVALARNGADLVISDKPDVSLDTTRGLIAPYARRVFAVPIDVRVPQQILVGAATIEREFGRVDILVNNAGINRPTAPLDVTTDNWDDHFHTNVRGGFLMTQAVAKG